MKKIVMIFAVTLFCMQSCYQDKGNYEYSKIPGITIDIFKVQSDGTINTTPIKENDRLYAYLAEPFRLVAKINFEDSTKLHNDFSYKWSLDNVLLSTKKDLDVNLANTPELFDLFGDLTVTDNTTGLSYVHKIRVSIASNFATGWMWLSKNGDKTELNLFRNDNKGFYNIYNKVEQEELDTDSYGIVEHFQSTNNQYPFGNILIASSGSKGNGSVELDNQTLKKRSYLKQEFMGGDMPEGVKISSVSYIDNYSAIISDKGKLFLRYSRGGNFNEGLFNTVPVYGNYNLSDKVGSCQFPYPYTFVFFDKTRKAYAYLKNGALAYFNEVQDLGTAFDVNHVDMELRYITAISEILGKGSQFFALLKSTENNYYVQQFEVGYNKETHLKTICEYKFEWQELIDDNSIFYATWKSNNVLFTKGDKLYLYNRDTKTQPIEVKSFNGKRISSIASGVALHAWTSYKNDVGVTVENGNNSYDFFLISVDAATLGSVKTEQKGLVGNGVTMVFKAGNRNYYNN